jgi:hypothetical protein
MLDRVHITMVSKSGIPLSSTAVGIYLLAISEGCITAVRDWPDRPGSFTKLAPDLLNGLMVVEALPGLEMYCLDSPVVMQMLSEMIRSTSALRRLEHSIQIAIVRLWKEHTNRHSIQALRLAEVNDPDADVSVTHKNETLLIGFSAP